ncbi:MAG: RNA polymerase sigma-70 factor [Bacteroidales bacterium]
MNSKDTKQIVHNLSMGSSSALRQLYDKYAPTVYRFVFSVLRNPHDSEEITQMVFIKIWDIRSTLRDDTNLISFLLTIAKNSSYNFLKHKYKEKLMFEKMELSLKDKASGLVDNTLIEKDLNDMLSTLIDKLPPRRREVFVLNRFKGLSYKEIADKLEISENTVDTQMRKALQFIKDNLANEISLSIFISVFIKIS